MANMPIKKWRSGAFDAAIWLNRKEKENGETFEYKSVTLQRNWQDRDQGVWRNEKINLRRQDLPRVQILVQKLIDELFVAKENEKEESDRDE